MHRLYHGYAIPTVDRKARVFTEWALNFVFGRDITTLRHERDPRPKREQRRARERDQALRFLDRVKSVAVKLSGEHGWERLLVSGGRVVRIPLAEGFSTSTLIARIRTRQ